MRLAFFEDEAVSLLSPLTLLRPVFELVCGRFACRERWLRRSEVSDWGALIRTQLIETYREEHPHAKVNDSLWLQREPTVLINGRWFGSVEELHALQPDEVGLIEETIVGLIVQPDESTLLCDFPCDEALTRLARLRTPRQMSGTLINRPWDLVNQNPRQLVEDFLLTGAESSCRDFGPHVALLGPQEKIQIDATASIDPFVVIDAREGPVSVDPGAVIRSFTALEGPCHIGAESQLFRAHVRAGTTIGTFCRVGGEIEASILHSHVNKYHTGFLGHSYVCPWVNLGALSTNSDLKNDYSSVRVPLEGEMVESGITKVGCFIGDHTKTALGSLFNTGSSIGVLAMVLPGGELLPKHIPSFTSIWHGALSEGSEFDRALEIAGVAMGRRDRELTAAQARLLRSVFEATRAERSTAIDRYREKVADRAHSAMH